MDSIGAEVGQKMRSAIKAKLMELNCYVDDELPDYIMVMVANKRTKSQMNEDLQLFLTTKTSAFVDWLHIVLKKLKEVSVTNPDVYKKGTKRKSDEQSKSDIKVKKEKKNKVKNEKKIKKKELEKPVIKDLPEFKSLTDDLPININKLQEKRRIMLVSENQNTSNSIENVNDDSFDIPLLSEVNLSNESELEDIERKIRNVKSRLGLLVESDSDDNDCINLKAEPEDLFPNEPVLIKKIEQQSEVQRKIKLIRSINEETNVNHENNNGNKTINKPSHARITFNTTNNNETLFKKKSVLERLGKRSTNNSNEFAVPTRPTKKTRISLSEYRVEEEKILGTNKESDHHKINKVKKDNIDYPEESVLNWSGVMSKVSVPNKEPEESEEISIKEVPSIVKIKPRVIPATAKQANKNLLLKAMAEAQRSIAQTPTVGNNVKPDALFTKKYKEKLNEEKTLSKKIPEKEKAKIKNIIVQVSSNQNKKYENDFGQNLTQIEKEFNSDTEQDLDKNINQQFIVTLDGIDESKFKTKQLNKNININKESKQKIDGGIENKARRTPSPIIFDNVTANIKTKVNIPDKLPVIHPSPAIKNKERCKYWPICRQGEKCEFVHPTTSCKMFPQCKFGDKCLYLHPSCKFEQSCTRRDCPYSHLPIPKTVTSQLATTTSQTCKYYPNCSNPHCTFYHPKPCKFGKYCKNQGECNFSHTFVSGKNNLIWRSSFKC